MRQTDRGARIVVQAAREMYLTPVRETISAALARLSVVDPQVTITPVERLDRLASTGKLQRFVAQAA